MIVKFFIGIIRIYQIGISPLIGHHCKFHPTCSMYAIDALKTFGLVRGSMKALFRIARCGPWSKGGFDPISNLNSNTHNLLTKEVFHG